eukprot:g2284.t1
MRRGRAVGKSRQSSRRWMRRRIAQPARAAAARLGNGVAEGLWQAFRLALNHLRIQRHRASFITTMRRGRAVGKSRQSSRRWRKKKRKRMINSMKRTTKEILQSRRRYGQGGGAIPFNCSPTSGKCILTLLHHDRSGMILRQEFLSGRGQRSTCCQMLRRSLRMALTLKTIRTRAVTGTDIRIPAERFFTTTLLKRARGKFLRRHHFRSLQTEKHILLKTCCCRRSWQRKLRRQRRLRLVPGMRKICCCGDAGSLHLWRGSLQTCRNGVVCAPIWKTQGRKRFMYC